MNAVAESPFRLINEMRNKIKQEIVNRSPVFVMYSKKNIDFAKSLW